MDQGEVFREPRALVLRLVDDLAGGADPADREGGGFPPQRFPPEAPQEARAALLLDGNRAGGAFMPLIVGIESGIALPFFFFLERGVVVLVVAGG